MPGGVEEGVVLPGVQTGGQQAAAVRIPPAALSGERSTQTKLGSKAIKSVVFWSFLALMIERGGGHEYTHSSHLVHTSALYVDSFQKPSMIEIEMMLVYWCTICLPLSVAIVNLYYRHLSFLYPSYIFVSKNAIKKEKKYHPDLRKAFD